MLQEMSLQTDRNEIYEIKLSDNAKLVLYVAWTREVQLKSLPEHVKYIFLEKVRHFQ